MVRAGGERNYSWSHICMLFTPAPGDQASQDRQAGPPINVVMLSDYSELHYRAEAQGESAVF